jgi:hypothetical protein
MTEPENAAPEVTPAAEGPVTLDPAVTRPPRRHRRKVNPALDDTTLAPPGPEPPPVATARVAMPAVHRAELSVAFADNPLSRILAWVETHGVPAVEQLTQLVSLAEHVAAKQAKQQFTRAFAQLQHALKPVTPTSSSTFGPYATLGDIVSAVREPLAAQGFALSFRLSEVQTDAGVELLLTTMLSHVDGHTETCTIAVPIEVGPVSSRTGEAVRSVAQARAAAVTSARRLSVLALLNLTTGESEQPEPVAQGPVVPEGAEAAEAQLQAVTSRAALLEAWSKLPFVMRRYLQAEKPQLVESLKAKFPEEPAAETAGP